MDNRLDIHARENQEIDVIAWDLEKNSAVVDHTVSVSSISKMTLGQFASLLFDFVNVGMKGHQEGLIIGRALTFGHKTVQRSIVGFALGLIMGIADQDLRFTDPRNEKAVIAAKRVAELVNSGDINIGRMI